MADVYRVMVVLLFFFVSPLVRAQVQYEYQVQATTNGQTAVGEWSDSQAGACTSGGMAYLALAQATEQTYSISFVSASVVSTACQIRLQYQSLISGSLFTTGPNAGFNQRVKVECPAGQTRNEQGICYETCQSKVDTLNRSGDVLVGSSTQPDYKGCHRGCQVEGSLGAVTEGQSVLMIAGPFKTNGQSCVPSPSAPGEPASAPSPGQCPGTVNGTSVSLPCGPSKAPSPSTSTPPPTTAPTPPGTPPGTTGGGETTCIGGLCITETTTTTNNGDGTTTTETETETQTEDEFCATNPGSPLCEGDESSFAGTCAATSCTGDAIQCAIAQEQARRMCELLDVPANVLTGGTTVMAGGNPANHPANAVNQQVINLSSMISSVPLFGASGQCPQDVSFSIQGHTIAIPFANLCPYLQMLGAAFLAACYLAAAFICFKRS